MTAREEAPLSDYAVLMLREIKTRHVKVGKLAPAVEAFFRQRGFIVEKVDVRDDIYALTEVGEQALAEAKIGV